MRVFVERIHRDEPFLLSAPDALAARVQPGCQVLVKLAGHRASAYVGYVAGFGDESGEATLEGEVLDVLNDGRPMLTPQMLKLALWMSEHYVARPIDCITTALPAPLRSTVDEVVELCDFRLESPESRVVSTGLRRKILRMVSRDKRLTIRQLRKRLGRTGLYSTLAELERGGLVRISRRFTESKPRTVTAWRLSPTLPDEPEKLIARSPRKREALELLSAEPDKPLRAEESGISRAVLNGLVELGLAEKIEIAAPLKEGLRFDEVQKEITALSHHQQLALDALTGALEQQQFQTFLLHGVTGSGKTLVYIELLRQVLDSGKTAIVLVPEIALTPQTAARFRHYFRDDIQIMHSAMSDQEKYEAWQRLSTGKARIALGARSTLFAPLENVGAIIVDEEHDAAYKQDRTPRYHARDTAVMRARFENAICLLGSATPSFESYNNAAEGKYTLLELPERIDQARMPSVELVWMPGSQRVTPSISGALYDAIRERLKRNEQVILLQNRRGFAGSLLCLECGHTPQCSHCNIPLVYHSTDRTLRCHYCGHIETFRETCPSCKSGNLFYKSSGTERIEEELGELFPDEKILRMDIDTTSTKDAHTTILTAFRNKTARILLGTQMVAKGLDFPDVTLVGVLMADIGLNLPDFRASERIYSLLTQVSGRAGRASRPGEVLLQLYNRDNELFSHVLKSDYRHFFEAEMASRRDLAYPPFSRLIKFECSSPSEQAAERGATALREKLEPQLPEQLGTILGPAPAGIMKMKGRFRFQLILKLFGVRLPSSLLRQVQYDALGLFRGDNLVITVDVDPQHLL
ncbi:MAG TPA: primosomal protein N' [Chlorobaculum parvum]|uniref:Replication restart protein PriA n=1 Tax=Chlorobaculum parvum TaxID=274539 RepID=A0A7C5HR07_9CHLB|nr:primosomal protein N' [Chlorobaculum parvum]